ncbi:MAG: proline--tRNA ligase [Bdellovibrionales bacterium]|nr:proline--tRNA ligase [Bdellovibrionales bacterium]
MKQSEIFLYTLHDPPADAEVPSHKLLAQAGFIQKLAAGIYSYTPAMWRVLSKISAIVREEMDRARPEHERAGAQELMMPILQPRGIWDESGRWNRYVQDGILFHFTDRKDSEVCLGPTHEEVITKIADCYISSYKQLPVNLYQIQTKFRDEIRPRFGLMRGREFIMKDAYSFDIDEAGLDKSYAAMDAAYRDVFRRCGLDFMSVEADSGAIGGSGSSEFIVTADTGEDLFIICDETGYASNQESAVAQVPPGGDGGSPEALENVSTPGAKTIEDLTAFFKLPADRFIKTLFYKAVYPDREEHVCVLIRGDLEINEVKLVNELAALGVELAEDKAVQSFTGAEVGFAGPVGLKADVVMLADESVAAMKNAITGANRTDEHIKNVNPGRDFDMPKTLDLRLARAGDLAVPRNDAEAALPAEKLKLRETRGIEVGHIFKLGDKYSSAMQATYTAENGKPVAFQMGCYGIGVSRVAAAAIEQNHDEKGMIWPLPIAPWQVHLVCVNPKRDDQREVADKLYQELQDAGVEVLYDDRTVSAGIKFNDSDLIGLPLRITVGRDAAEGQVEFSVRKNTADKSKISVAEAAAKVAAAMA